MISLKAQVKTDIEDLSSAIILIEKFISDLKSDSEIFYSNGDNWRGNKYHDGAHDLETYDLSILKK